MTVFQNMAYGLKLRRRPSTEIAAKIAGLLSLLHLEGLGDRNVIAGDEQQNDKALILLTNESITPAQP
jgi:ABC-type sulfate/molybdate transport systems ATPase subunit